MIKACVPVVIPWIASEQILFATKNDFEPGQKIFRERTAKIFSRFSKNLGQAGWLDMLGSVDSEPGEANIYQISQVLRNSFLDAIKPSIQIRLNKNRNTSPTSQPASSCNGSLYAFKTRSQWKSVGFQGTPGYSIPGRALVNGLVANVLEKV